MFAIQTVNQQKRRATKHNCNIRNESYTMSARVAALYVLLHKLHNIKLKRANNNCYLDRLIF